MSIDNKPRIQLRIINKNSQDTINEQLLSQPEGQVDKRKGKRGRPRKIPIENETSAPDSNNSKQIQTKKRGRKKKNETSYNLSTDSSKGQTTFSTSLVTKNYIVQLKVKSSDLEKIQKQFITKTQQIGYKPLVTQKPVDNSKFLDLADIEEKQKDTHFDEYFKLLNSLEMPLISVPDLMQQNMICGDQKNNLPEIPIIYHNLAITVLPGNVPLKLFNEDDEEENLTGVNAYQGEKSKEENSKAFRNTTNLILPQFSGNGGKWPEKSPYACWTCDIFFDGTPIGIPEKESEGQFHCYGNFCDFPCAARYLCDREDKSEFWTKYSLLCVVYQKAYSLPPDTRVPIAPPRESLSKFGGKLSYEEYHQARKLNKTIEIYKLPLIPVMLHIEEISKSTNINNIIEKNNSKQNFSSKIPPKIKKVNRFIPIDPQKLIKAEENLKLKTQERLQSNYTLDDCFIKGGNN